MIHRIRAHADCPQHVLPCLAWRAALPTPAAPPASPLTAPGAHDARGRHYAAAAAPPPPPLFAAIEIEDEEAFERDMQAALEPRSTSLLSWPYRPTDSTDPLLAL